MSLLPIAVIGAGPVGLAAAAHIVDRGLIPLVIEAGPKVGHTVRQWAHVSMFSPWGFTTDRVARRLLEASGWTAPDAEEVPTGGDLVSRYLKPLAALPSIAPHIRFGARVVAVGRKDFDKVRTNGRDAQPFLLQIENADGSRSYVEAGAVIDASGTWTSPNPIGSGGLPVPGEADCRDLIAYGIPDVLGTDRHLYRDQAVMVVGSGHSAINALLELTELQEASPATRILWASRREQIESAYGGGEGDALPARGALGVRTRQAVADGRIEVLTPFRISALRRQPTGVTVDGTLRGIPTSIDAGRLIVATGFRPNFDFLREVRLDLDPWLESTRALGPLIDPNLHSCGTVRPHGAKELAHPEKDFYIAGMKSYGRAPTFLLATGHEQVRSIVASLAGDHAAAARVELELPETGVCNATPKIGKTAPAEEAAAGCCGPAVKPKVRVAAGAATKEGGCCG